MTATAPFGAPVVPFPTVRLGTEPIATRVRALVIERPAVWFDAPPGDTVAVGEGAALVRSAAAAATAVAAGFAADRVIVASTVAVPAGTDHPALWLAPDADRSTQLASIAWAVWHGYRLVTASDAVGAERVCRTVEAILGEALAAGDG